MADVTREKYKAKKINEYRQALPEFCGEYCDELKEKASATQYLYLQDLNNFFCYLAESVFHVDDMKNVTADEFFSTVTEETIFEYFRTKEDSPSFTDSSVPHGKEITRLISIFKSFFSFYRRRGYITVDPSSTLVHSKAKPRNELVTHLDDCEVEKIGSAYLSDVNPANLSKKIIINLMLHYGFTLNDISCFKLSDFSYTDKTIKIIRFNDEYLVRVADSDVELIHDYLIYRHINPLSYDDSDLLLLVNLKNKKLQLKVMQILMSEFAQEMGICTVFSQKVLQSTFAQRYYDATRDVELIRIILEKEFDPVYRYVTYRKREILEIGDKAF